MLSLGPIAQTPRQTEPELPFAVLGQTRRLTIRLPERYDRHERRFPVVYVFGAHDPGEFGLFASNFDYLGAMDGDLYDYAAPEVVVVGVHNPGAGRTQNLLLNAPNFTRFLVEELVPFIDKTYRTVPYRVLVGHSLGGLFVTKTLLAHPGLFRAAVSPYLMPGGPERQLAAQLDAVLRRAEAQGQSAQPAASRATLARARQREVLTDAGRKLVEAAEGKLTDPATVKKKPGFRRRHEAADDPTIHYFSEIF